ncbi:hypothetical protein ASD78_16440 [Lysobacter sp. Root667]|uniref:hypothetical protein n=1 Tax=Lysobacter sp. Root667 TaxID=1736581 RepID=UPI0007020D7E|nr:hypothetical protein [Lysobacter sp. Root667]KRA71959.1 hypothetical protein ASD78_16440 [Lysobacter sp. Root667]
MNRNDPRYGADPGTGDDERRFDEAARALHRQALGAVSPATRARLRTARHASVERARAPRRGLGWALASGCAAVFALAIGVQLQRAPQTAAPPVATPPVAMLPAPEAAAYDNATALASLDENPDFYLWLASADDLPATE